MYDIILQSIMSVTSTKYSGYNSTSLNIVTWLKVECFQRPKKSLCAPSIIVNRTSAIFF